MISLSSFPKLIRRILGCMLIFLVLIIIMIIATLIPAAHYAVACEATTVGRLPPTPIPLETQVAGVNQNAQIVIDGIVKTWVASSDMQSILTVQVERYLKGSGPQTVKILGDFWICAPNFAFEEGSHSIFFVTGDPASTQPLQNRGWFPAQEAVVTSVRNATGQEPTAPDGTVVSSAGNSDRQEPTASNGTDNVLWLSLLTIVILGLIMLLRDRDSQS